MAELVFRVTFSRIYAAKCFRVRVSVVSRVSIVRVKVSIGLGLGLVVNICHRS